MEDRIHNMPCDTELEALLATKEYAAQLVKRREEELDAALVAYLQANEDLDTYYKGANREPC